jgi:hypothetical protein
LSETTTPEHTNRLIHESSPYLRQHAHNPVDWYPWGDEAFERARREDKPILVSIGYAACHWCHVMERESFENDSIAALMNERFVCVKVDREERPDVDAQYMLAVQMMGQQGGWPLNVFLTPDLVPFYGGTYFPPEDRYGRPGFPSLLVALDEYYRTEKEDLTNRTERLAFYLAQASAMRPADKAAGGAELRRAYHELSARYDTRYGGFGRAPKFPQPSVLEFLLVYAHRAGQPDALEMVLTTLRNMARGGMYDQIGGGFHRYSVDDRWLVPHFEKMLYDNALLPPVYLAAHQITGDAFAANVVRETLDYVLRDLTSLDGGFYASEDADSEGVEGKFYVWSLDDVTRLLGAADGGAFAAYYDITEGGNWEGTNILNVPQDVEVVARRLGMEPSAVLEIARRGRRTLFEARERRVRPGLDDKTIAGWNGLMIAALARAGAVLGEPRYVEAAIRGARFMLDALSQDGRLLRTRPAGSRRIAAFLDDYAYVVRGLLDLYEATFDGQWLTEASRLAQTMIRLFWDDESGGFFTTSVEHDRLVSRLKDSHDGATPSGNAVAVGALRRLAVLAGDENYAEKARRTLLLFADSLREQPTGYTEMLVNVAFDETPPKEIVLVGDPSDEALREALQRVRRAYVPGAVVVRLRPETDDYPFPSAPLVMGKTALDGMATFYVCQNGVCQRPTTDVDAFARELGVD